MARICIFSKTFYPAIGGLETMARILATEGVSAGHQIEVVTDSRALSAEDDHAQPYRITRTTSFSGRVTAFRRAQAVLSMNVSLHGTPAARWAGTRVVYSHQNTYDARGMVRQCLEFAKRRLTRHAINICASEFVAQRIPGDSLVVPNAYDGALYSRSPAMARQRDLVFCGRLVSDKGADLCVKAFQRACSGASQPTLTIVGEGPERQALERLVTNLGLEKSVRFSGPLVGETLASELRRHACLVVPSIWEEPFGIVALEGLACCDTVIVTRRGGLPEAVGKYGVIVEPTEADLAKAMISVIEARQRGAALPGQPTDEERERHLAIHSPASVARQYFDVIEAVIASRRNERNS